MLFNSCRGIDNTQLNCLPERKSMGVEVNWGIRFKDRKKAEIFFSFVCVELANRLHQVIYLRTIFFQTFCYQWSAFYWCLLSLLSVKTLINFYWLIYSLPCTTYKLWSALYPTSLPLFLFSFLSTHHPPSYLHFYTTLSFFPILPSHIISVYRPV